MFVVIIEDRHTDIDVQLFEELYNAIIYAKKEANELCSCKKDYKEIKVKSCLFYVEFSCEGDNIHIIKRNVY